MTTPTTKPAATVSVFCPVCCGEGREEVSRCAHGSCDCDTYERPCATCDGTGSVYLALSTENEALGAHRGDAVVEAALIAAGLVAWWTDEAGTTYAVDAKEAAQGVADGVNVTWFRDARPGLVKTSPAPMADLAAAAE